MLSLVHVSVLLFSGEIKLILRVKAFLIGKVAEEEGASPKKGCRAHKSSLRRPSGGAQTLFCAGAKRRQSETEKETD